MEEARQSVDVVEEQRRLCAKHNAAYMASPPHLKVGISRNISSGMMPLTGIRSHAPEHGTAGWFLWAGEKNDDPDFFIPVHISHLDEMCPAVLKYLGLPPGWGFIVAGDYEDVWYDPTYLEERD
jgi:hypothetical protein